MQKQMRKIKTIPRELQGNACPFCGGHVSAGAAVGDAA
jgi:hypothetical protein